MQAFHNTPSAGYIAWQDVHIQYKGTTYNIPNGNTDKRFVIWRYADPDCFYGSDEFPTLGPEDLLVFLNKNGTYAIVPKTQIVDGSLIVSDSIMTDALAANSVTTEKIAAGAITADLIAANAIGAGAIAAGTIGADEIAAGAIATGHLAALAVTADKIAAGAVTADKIEAGAITTAKLSVDVAAGLTGPIDADDRPISAMGNQITLDEDGLAMRPTGESNDLMRLDSTRLEFWDQNAERAVALGDVTGLPETLGMHYGLFIRKGLIIAPQGVVSDSLTDGGTTTAKLADGGVTLAKLSEDLSVTIPDRFQLVQEWNPDAPAEQLANPGFEDGNMSGWSGVADCQVISVNKHSGSYAVRSSSPTRAPTAYQEASASPGQLWVAEGWVNRYDASHTLRLRIQFLDSDGAVLFSASSSAAATKTWERLVCGAVAPANTTKARLTFLGSGVTSGGTSTYWDDFSLKQCEVGASYATIASKTIPKTECCEQVKILATVENPDATSVSAQIVVNALEAAVITSSSTTIDLSIIIDMREYDGDQEVALRLKQSGSAVVYLDDMKLLQNQRLPLRAVAPMYAVTSASESSCSVPCEQSCQAQCQKRCESSCQSSCQDTCQGTCMSNCETTAQGGGCWVEGVPVTVYDLEKEISYDIPVEQLEPGMIMPWYNIAADTIELTECVSNTRTWTHTIYEIGIEGGYRLEATGEQPLDVLRGSRWFKLPARDIQASDRLVRPFDGTLHEVQSVKRTVRARTWVYNPKTTSGSYIANGFSDMAKAL